MLFVRLSIMMFLEFFLWGSWYVTAYLFLGKIGFGGGEIGWTYSVGPIAGMISPFFVGMIADRFFSTERVLGTMHLLGGGAMFAAVALMKGDAPSPVAVNIFFFAHMICFFPTLALTNTLALHNMTNAEKQFPLIRVFGTIGWIIAGIFISYQGWDASINMFLVAAITAIVMGLYSFTLPHTPPPSAGKEITVREILGIDALVLLKRPSFLMFMISSFLICIPLAFYYQLAGKFVDHAGLANPAFKMTFGQMSEILFMVAMPLFFVRLGVKWMLFVGMLAWVARYALFTFGASDGTAWMVLGGIVLHGICYDFFFVTGQIYTDKVAPSAIRGQAQGMLVLFTLGLGMFIGAQSAGQIEKIFTPHNSKDLSDQAELIAPQIQTRQDEVDKAEGTFDKPSYVRVLRFFDPLEMSQEEQAKVDTLKGELDNLRTERKSLLLQSVHWLWIWGIPALFAFAIMMLFACVFRDDGSATSISEAEVAQAAAREEGP